MTKSYEQAFDDGIRRANAFQVIDEEIVDPVKEDQRLFYTYKRTGRTVRMNIWFPFEERYWPFANYDDVLEGGARILLLIREYSQEKGEFVHLLSDIRTKISAKEHPNRTKAYVGFMILAPSAAMASLLIPEDFGSNILG